MHILPILRRDEPAFLSAAASGDEIPEMLAVYKAPVELADVPTIVAYLGSIKGSRLPRWAGLSPRRRMPCLTLSIQSPA